MLILVQQIGRSSRDGDGVLGDPTDALRLVINHNDHICVLERACRNKGSAESDSKECLKSFNHAMTKEKTRELEKRFNSSIEIPCSRRNLQIRSQ